MHAAARLLAAAALLLAAAAAAVASEPQGSVEFNPSVMILGSFDWEPYQATPPFTSRCTDSVNRAAALGGTRLNFIPTHYWRDDNGDGIIDSFCWMDSNMQCRAFDDASVAAYRTGLALCFRRAVELNMGISIVPHLDDGSGSATWRNGLLFVPTTSYGGMSYEQVLLQPLADALAEVLSPATTEPGRAPAPPLRVWLALQGEMSATVMRYPAPYTQLIGKLKSRMAERMAAYGTPAARIQTQLGLTKVGVSFNFNKLLEVNTGGLAGGGSLGSFLSRIGRRLSAAAAPASPQEGFAAAVAAPERALPTVRTATGSSIGPHNTKPRNTTSGCTRSGSAPASPAAAAAVDFAAAEVDAGAPAVPAANRGATRSLQAVSVPALDLAALRVLFNTVDWVGISAYSALRADFKMNELQDAAFTFFDEARAAGIDVAAIIASRGLELHYSEFGLGGGQSPTGRTPARTADQVARTPFYGVNGPYRKSADPWQNPELRAFMQRYYRTALQWLSQGGGPTYPISACFMWNLGSWDVLGIYPESTNAQGSYRDPAVVDMVRAHNDKLAPSK